MVPTSIGSCVFYSALLFFAAGAFTGTITLAAGAAVTQIAALATATVIFPAIGLAVIALGVSLVFAAAIVAYSYGLASATGDQRQACK